MLIPHRDRRYFSIAVKLFGICCYDIIYHLSRVVNYKSYFEALLEMTTDSVGIGSSGTEGSIGNTDSYNTGDSRMGQPIFRSKKKKRKKLKLFRRKLMY